jgi:predicted dehydrogenase/threonine dehydrogenase-like Zn-dependent dehydrogenase
MKQVLQDLRTGETEVAEVPCPEPGFGRILVRSVCSVVSAGTERMLVEFGRAGLIEKARQQPEKVRMALDKVRTDGLVPTVTAVRAKLDEPLPMGYSNSGSVVAIGSGVTGFSVGDRVATNGRHAEYVCVPVNLAARVPDDVADEDAAFTTVAAIALQGVRLVCPALGESVVVTGLGLIGLITVQLLRANGCRVLGLDFDHRRLELAKRFGAEVADLSAGADPVAAALAFSDGRGADAVLITASTTSNDPLRHAAVMSRKRGRIVLVGVAGLELSRAEFYEKEITFQVSCSYGPGRYDPNYEDHGHDYPIGFVRWTEQRNFEAILSLLSQGRLDVRALITHRYPIDDAPAAYRVVAGSEPSLAIVLSYPRPDTHGPGALRRRTVAVDTGTVKLLGRPRIGFIGAGNYATSRLIPAFRRSNVILESVASNAGISSLHAARKYGFHFATSDVSSILDNDAIDAAVIATRHDTHAALVVRALAAGKHVYVEKPLCLTFDELALIETALSAEGRAAGRILMVGFNRRFAPLVQRIKHLLAATVEPKTFVMTVNAGAVPESHWTQDPAVGGGRFLGEGCHFVDLLRHLADAPIRDFTVVPLRSPTRDTGSVSLAFGDGSIGTIHYFANGSRTFPKERLEVFAGGRILQLDNFRRLRSFGWQGAGAVSSWRQDKGQTGCARAFVDAVTTSGLPPIPIGELIEVARMTIEISQRFG